MSQQQLSDYDITIAMLTFGGSFAENLAHTWRAADPINQARLKDAFPDYWAQYEKLALLKQHAPKG